MTCHEVAPSLSLLAFKNFVRSVVRCVLFLLLLNVSAANAQNLGGLEQGIKPYGSYEGGNIDSVSMSNGSLTVHMPLLTYQQRGGKLQVSFSLLYANPMLQPWAVCDPRTKYCSQSGYNLVYGQYLGLTYPQAINAIPDFVPRMGATYLDASYTATDPDGAVHLLANIPSQQRYRSEDATGYLYEPYGNGEGVLTDHQGNIYSFTNGPSSAQFEDSNGNIVTTNANSQGGITGWTDTMGRVIPAPTNTTSGNLQLCPGSANATSATLWSPPGPNGGTSPFTFCWATINISFTPPDCTANNSNCLPTSTTSTQMVGLVLPNSTAWTFFYDSLGELTTVTLPTGGSISYTWGYIYGGCVAAQYIEPISEANTGLWPYRRAVTSRKVIDETGSHLWSYVLSPTYINGSVQTIATDPLGNDTVHSETGLGGTCALYETETD